MNTNVSTVTETADARAHSPGKLILSGEHSVLYGAPALAIAVAKYTDVWFKAVSPGQGLKTAFKDISSGAIYPSKFLSKFKSVLDNRFDQFTRGELDVRKILTRPDDLAVYALASLLQDHEGETVKGFGALHHLPTPGQLGSESTIPIGSGMGSSAAVVAATTVLFETLLKRHKTLDERFDRVRFCERLKHGKAGPIDAATVVRGGMVYFDESRLTTPDMSDETGLARGEGWYTVLHGMPESSTGECVKHVRDHHAHDTALWDQFATCTKHIAKALADGHIPKEALQENQRLLEHIGIVPEDTQAFVRKVEALGGVAKTCGAGSVRGSNGGAILVHLDDPAAMANLMQDHLALPWGPLRMSKTGAATGPSPTVAIEEPT